MGRYVYKITGKINFDYKFWFGEQPSDFGEVLEEALPDKVARYISNSCDSEVVYVCGKPEEIIKGIEEYMEEEDLPEYDVEMLKKFIEAVKETKSDEYDLVTGWFYVEY